MLEDTLNKIAEAMATQATILAEIRDVLSHNVKVKSYKEAKAVEIEPPVEVVEVVEEVVEVVEEPKAKPKKKKPEPKVEEQVPTEEELVNLCRTVGQDFDTRFVIASINFFGEASKYAAVREANDGRPVRISQLDDNDRINLGIILNQLPHTLKKLTKDELQNTSPAAIIQQVREDFING